MSKLPVELGDRRVVVSVVVMLLAIMILNWRVFQPLRAKQAEQEVAGDESVYLPPDLGEMTSVAVARLGRAGAGAEAHAAGRAGFGADLRDPFRTRTDPAPAPIVSRAAGDRSEPAKPRLACAAVLLGGRRPTALIGGGRYHPGDHVAGYRVTRVTAEGAHLEGAQGSLFLPVGGHARATVHHPPIRGSRPDGSD